MINDSSQYLHQKKYFNEEFSQLEKYCLESWQKSYLRRMLNSFYISKEKNKVFLDIGCGGSGYTVIELAKKGITSIGCDLSKEGIKKANYFAQQEKVSNKAFFVICSADHLPFKKDSFDFISSNAVLEHIPNDKITVKEISRVAKNKSKLFITVPLSYTYIWPFLWMINYIHDKQIGHLRRYNKRILNNMFNPYKFNLENIYYTGHLPKVIWVLLSKLIKSKFIDNLIEKFDSLEEKIRYGSSNIIVVFNRGQ